MPDYNCDVHGRIQNDTLQINMDDEEHNYCMRCLDDALLKNFKTVEIVEDENAEVLYEKFGRQVNE